MRLFTHARGATDFFSRGRVRKFFRYNSRKCLYYATDAMETERFETFLQPICNRLIMVTQRFQNRHLTVS